MREPAYLTSAHSSTPSGRTENTIWPAGSPSEVQIHTFPSLEDAASLLPEPPELARTGSGFARGDGDAAVESIGEANSLNWPQ